MNIFAADGIGRIDHGLVDLFQVFRRAFFRALLGGQHNQRAGNIVKRGDVFTGKAGDLGSFSRSLFHQPLFFQQFQRLSDRAAADLEVGGQLSLADAFARFELKPDDFFPDVVGNLFRQTLCGQKCHRSPLSLCQQSIVDKIQRRFFFVNNKKWFPSFSVGTRKVQDSRRSLNRNRSCPVENPEQTIARILFCPDSP